MIETYKSVKVPHVNYFDHKNTLWIKRGVLHGVYVLTTDSAMSFRIEKRVEGYVLRIARSFTLGQHQSKLTKSHTFVPISLDKVLLRELRLYVRISIAARQGGLSTALQNDLHL